MNSSHSYWPTIPKIIHQTWKDNNIPGPAHWPDSWKKINPDWDYRLWTDADLLALVQRHYPALEELYTSYPNPVQRADLGRYLVLHHCGGIYSDIDTECLSPLDPLSEDKRVVFAEEPVEHHHHTIPLGLNRQFFNGIMASPKGHPFWEHMIEMVVRCRHAKNFVLESTGPIVLSGAVESYPEQDQLCLNSCHIFNPLTVTGGEDSEFFLRAKRQHGIVIASWPNAIAYEKQRGHRLTLSYHLNRTLSAQTCGFYIAELHRKNRIIENPAPLGLMLTRRTIKSVGSGLYVLSLGLLTLPFATARGQRMIGLGLEHLSRAFAVLPFLFGKSYRRYGVSKS